MNYSRTIRLADTDAAGVVYFAQILSICHEAYEASLDAAGIDLRAFFRDGRSAIPIVHGEGDFFRPLFCGDRLLINLTSQSLSDSEFEITYEIFAEAQLGECLARAKTRHVCINPISRSRMRLPEPMLQWLLGEVKED